MSANRTLLRVILLACVAAVLVAGGLGVHRYRKRSAVDAAHAKGLQAYEARQYTTAAVELGRYVNVHRDDSDALLKYADAQLQRRPQGKGSLEQAVGALEGILRRQPGHAEAAERLSSIYVAVNSPIEVERVARAWSQADPNSAPAKRQLAIALALQKKPGEARKLIDQVVAERPADPKAPEVLMRLVLSQENAASTSAPASASQPADGAPTDPRVAECEKLLQDLATRNPEAAGIRLALAKFHRRDAARGRTVAQQHARALEHRGRAEELAGQDYEMLTEIGQLWREIGDFGRAAKTFARAEQLTPGRIEAYLIQAQLDLEADNYAGGATVADRALKAPVGERRADMLPLAVQFYSRTGRLSDARKYREERAKAGGESDELVYLDGVIQQGDGQLSKALQSFQDAAKRNPKQPRFQLALARAFAANGETERALNPFPEYARMAREAGVGTTPGDLELTSLYLRVGRWGDAVRSARSAVQGSVGTWLFTRAVLADMEVEASIARPNGPNPNPEVLANMAQRVSKLMADPEAAQHFTLQMLSARVAAWNGQVDQAIAALKAVAVEGDQRVAVLQEMVDLLADARRTDEAIKVCTEAAGAVDPRHRAAF